MNIVDVDYKIRCDMPNCKNCASIKVVNSGFFKEGLLLCKECEKELYRVLGERIVPKSPDNMLNKKIKTNKVSKV